MGVVEYVLHAELAWDQLLKCRHIQGSAARGYASDLSISKYGKPDYVECARYSHL